MFVPKAKSGERAYVPKVKLGEHRVKKAINKEINFLAAEKREGRGHLGGGGGWKEDGK